MNIGWKPWDLALERWRRETGDPDLRIEKVLGYDGCSEMYRGFDVPDVHCGIFPAFKPVVISEDEEFIVHSDERGITMRDRRDGGSMPEFLEYPVRDPSDWERLKTDRLRPEDPGRFAQDWDEFRARVKTTGEAVQVGLFPYGIFGTPRDLMGDEEILVSFHTNPDMVRDMMDHLTTLWITLWERIAREVKIDHIHIWEDMAGKQGSLISSRMVKEFMMPCYDRIADFAGSVGVRVISVDTDGDCSELVPIFVEHGVNVILPFEVQAGNDILEYRKLYPELGIIGGLDKRALAGSKADIDAEVEKAAKMIDAGRYIPMFDHLIPPDVPWENFRYAAEEIKKICYEQNDGTHKTDEEVPDD
ncbi:MAG: hypothetical protein A2147_11525 [Chloroflexi bacterium RBG_16_57_8]|nr:MAG: hypothetical protein A2147_11525 [Chloroflexi bacterium RBG_16_57_8]